MISTKGFHLCPNRYFAGLLRKFLNSEDVVYNLFPLTFGHLPDSKDIRNWFTQRQLWFENNWSSAHQKNIFGESHDDESNRSRFHDLLVGDLRSEVIGIWFGKNLSDQIFACFAIAALSHLTSVRELHLYYCDSNPRKKKLGTERMSFNDIARVEPQVAKSELVALAQRVWAIFCSTDVLDFNNVKDVCNKNLTNAIREYRHYLPDIQCGLDHWEKKLLIQLGQGGCTIAELVASCIVEEELNQVSITDHEVVFRIVSLSQINLIRPLLTICPTDNFFRSRVAITSDGEAVAKARTNLFHINFIEKSVFGLRISSSCEPGSANA